VIEGLPEGYGSRPATREDLAAIVELFHRFDATIQAEPDTMGEYLRWIWGQPQMDLARDTVLVTGPDGVEAFAQGNWDPETDEPFQLDWCVAPGSSSWARLVACLLSWAEAEATGRAGGAMIRTGIVAEDGAGREVLEGRGFREVRTSWDMGRELSPDERFPDPPDGITIRGFRAGEDEHLLYEIAETSFRDHWDHVERSFESFCARTFDETFDPGLTFFADVDGLTAGELIAFEDEARGYVAHLGVLREARGRGAAKALLRSAYAELAARGFRRVELSVDATSPTGAVALYEGQGMHVVRSYAMFDGPVGVTSG
jgi:ribosomal protein S18 acetylase RimI-like enzyme